MTGPRKPPREVVSDLLNWLQGSGQRPTAADTDAELAAADVDVPAFLTRVRERIASVEEEDRLRWKAEAQKKIATHKQQQRTGRYDSYDRTALMSELSQRQANSSSAQAFFHKLEELTDDDLRTLLEDQDALEET